MYGSAAIRPGRAGGEGESRERCLFGSERDPRSIVTWRARFAAGGPVVSVPYTYTYTYTYTSACRSRRRELRGMTAEGRVRVRVRVRVRIRRDPSRADGGEAGAARDVRSGPKVSEESTRSYATPDRREATPAGVVDDRTEGHGRTDPRETDGSGTPVSPGLACPAEPSAPVPEPEIRPSILDPAEARPPRTCISRERCSFRTEGE